MTKDDREFVRLGAFDNEFAGKEALDAVNTLAAEADRLEAERDVAQALADQRLADYKLVDETAQIDRALARRDLDKLRAECDRVRGLADERRALLDKALVEGIAGRVHKIDQAFYDLTRAQRDQAWSECNFLRAEVRKLAAVGPCPECRYTPETPGQGLCARHVRIVAGLVPPEHNHAPKVADG